MRRLILLCLSLQTAVYALQQPTLALITRRRTGRSGARASVRSGTDARRLGSVRSSTAGSSEPRPNLARTASAAALVAGTTVGGGFLGLPAVVKPAGFVPTVFVSIRPVSCNVCRGVAVVVPSFRPSNSLP